MFHARFAPTPSGFLHAGNALNFILTWVYARSFSARLGLRIDDLDPFRCEEKYVQYIFDALDWLGLSWDEPPFCMKEFNQSFTYKTREERYRKFLLHVKKSPLAYVCACSRKELKASDFNCTCKTQNLPLTPYQSALKFNIKAFGLEKLFGIDVSKLKNPVLWRKEDVPAYHLASLCDDSLMGSCLLVRGDDLREASAIQLLLAKSLGLDKFTKSIFIHHPLIREELGDKLSKSRKAPPLDFSRSSDFLYLKASEILGVKPSRSAYALLESVGKKENSFGLGFKMGGEK